MSDYQTDFPCCDAKGGHNTADRLIEIERRFNATFDDLDTRDIHWLISEVHRYRDEQNPNQAAVYYRRIQTLRAQVENQAATIKSFDSLTAALNRLCNLEWLKRRDRYMTDPHSGPANRGASVIERAAYEVRLLLEKVGVIEERHAEYLDWLNSGRPEDTK